MGFEVQSAGTKKHSKNRKSCIDYKFQSENCAIGDEDEPATGRARASNTDSGALVCCCACCCASRNRTTQTRPKQYKNKGARQAMRHTKGAETSDRTTSPGVLAGSKLKGYCAVDVMSQALNKSCAMTNR